MKRNAKKLLTALLAAAMLALCFASLAATATVVPTVTVNATAELEVEPDIAYVSLGVSTTETTAEAAKRNNTAVMNRVLAAVKAEGVAEKDMDTSLYMSTNYRWTDDNERIITGYTVDNSLTITVRNVDEVGDIVDAAMNAGANKFNSVRFDLDDDEAYYLEALAAATKKAQKRASTMVMAAGGKLGAVASMSMGNVRFDPIYEYPEEDAVADTDTEAGMTTGSGSNSASIGSTIQAGTITVSATVTIAYRID